MTTDGAWLILALPLQRNLHNDLADLARDRGVSVETVARMLLSRGVADVRSEMRDKHAAEPAP